MLTGTDLLALAAGVSMKVYDDLVDDYKVSTELTDTIGVGMLVTSILLMYKDAAYLAGVLTVIGLHLLLVGTKNREYKEAKEGIDTDIYKIGAVFCFVIFSLRYRDMLRLVSKYGILFVVLSVSLLLEAKYMYSEGKVDKIMARLIAVCILVCCLRYSYVTGKYSDLRSISYFLLGYCVTSVVSLAYQASSYTAA